ncbi:TolC family protein [Desulfoplanes sp.]
MKHVPSIIPLLLAICLLCPLSAQAGHNATAYSLSDCIASALSNNQRGLIAREGQAIARAQHQQALAAYWPSLAFSASGTMDDHDPQFVSEGMTVALPGMGSISVPDQVTKLRDNKNLDMDLTATWLLWGGGKRSAMARQAEIGVDMAGVDIVREELKLTLEAKQTYYGLVLARRLKALGHDTLERMEATLFVTKRFYEQGLGGVLKTDFLRNKYFVETIKTTVVGLDANVELASASLVNIMGLDWNEDIDIKDTAVPFQPIGLDTHSLVTDAYAFNVDMRSIELALKATREKIRESKAGYFPVVTLFGNFRKTINEYDLGIVTEKDKKRLTGGLNVTLPLFSGFGTRASVDKSQAILRQLKKKKIVFEHGLALHMKNLCLAAVRSARQVQTTRDAMVAARENRLLNEKAYTMHMVETRDIIEAQVAESLTAAGHYRARYAHYETLAKIEMLLGKQIADVLATN